MSDTDQIAPFYGEDDDSKESARDFLNKLERMYMRSTFTEPDKIRYFELSLKDGGPASQWFQDLAATEKATWSALANAFKIRWPAKTAASKTQAEKLAELRETKITEEELGKKVKVGGIEVYTHVAWADKIERLAKALSDNSNLLVQSMRDNMAPSLKAL
ncbi:hypothetical protein H0H81_008265, partial [Sphagnurus paluster]